MAIFKLNPQHPLKSAVTIGVLGPNADYIPNAIQVSSPRNGSPFESHALGSALANVLNDIPPVSSDMNKDHLVHYQRIDGGVVLRHRRPDQGVSVDGIDFTVSPGLPPELRTNILDRLSSATIMEKLCRAVEYTSQVSGPASQPNAPSP